MPGPAVYFVSDAHFSARDSDWEREKRRRFARFLEGLGDAERLYVVGDLFDFWFEYRRVMPAGFADVLMPLRRLVLEGSGVTLVGGNHDYWLGRHLAEEFGFQLARDGLLAEHQGRRLRIDHGDESLSGDRGYLALKAIVRQRAFIAAARLLHPDFTFWAADRLAHGSRWLDERDQERGRSLRPLRLKRLLAADFDALIFGHLHLGFHWRYRDWDLLCLGDWMRRFSYGRLADGELSLLDDRGGHYPVEPVKDPDRTPRCRIRPRGEGEGPAAD
jgi:UDP-2,3-diacylglucosamine hydrolase